MLKRLLLMVCMGLTAPIFAAAPRLLLPQSGIQPEQLAVIVNANDPTSVEIGSLYARLREIPDEHLVRLHLPPTDSALSPEAFRLLKEELDRQLPKKIQALLFTWIKPYRVGCMSLTSAFTFGYDAKYCSARQCAPTASSPYFNSSSEQPFTELGIRPSMMLGAGSIEEAKSIIGRGLRADGQANGGTAYLVSTSDKARNVRASSFGVARRLVQRWINVETPMEDAISGKGDVMFYFTGLSKVDKLDSNRFLPGAVADHLTSFGGQLTDSSQMSALEWLKAGATGSYGTVVEPCAHRQKFPDPTLVMLHYLSGQRLIEAYWKSVAWPGEGLFIGDPLAKPFSGYFAKHAGGRWTFEIPLLPAGRYRLEASASAFGPFKPLSVVNSIGQPLGVRLPPPTRPYYRLRAISSASLARTRP